MLRGRGARSRGARDGNFAAGATGINQSSFLTLDDFDEDGGRYDAGEDSSGEGPWEMVRLRGKRQRVSTGGSSNVLQDSLLDSLNVDTLSGDEKLNLILSKVTINEGKFEQLERKLDSVLTLRTRVDNMDTVIRSHENRLKLLEYKSIDIEARGRRCNLIFHGLMEGRRENCTSLLIQFLENELGFDDTPFIERAHRLGRFQQNKGPRPIIAAFNSYTETERIMSNARLLAGKPFSISRDFPKEIMNARKILWPKLKDERRKYPSDKTSIQYPAKLVVNGATCFRIGAKLFEAAVLIWNSIWLNNLKNDKVTSPQSM